MPSRMTGSTATSRGLGERVVCAPPRSPVFGRLAVARSALQDLTRAPTMVCDRPTAICTVFLLILFSVSSENQTRKQMEFSKITARGQTTIPQEDP